jgi:formate dehydrogenase assembly factor FdhD
MAAGVCWLARFENMEHENVEGRKERVKGGGVCIYCGCDGNENNLASEHTMPYALGGSTELLEASCSRCGAVTTARGASLFKMMDVSRHKSVDVLRGYVRDAEAFRDHAGAGLL